MSPAKGKPSRSAATVVSPPPTATKSKRQTPKVANIISTTSSTAAVVSPPPTTSKSKRRASKAVINATSSSMNQVLTGEENTNAILDNEVVGSTKTQYQSTFQFITNFMRENYPASIDAATDTLTLPMSMFHLRSILGDMAAQRPDKTIKATSTMTGYCSVIKYYYRKANKPIDAEHVRFFKSYQEGYKRTVAGKKNRGEMKQKEGKVGVTYQFYCELCKIALFASEMRSAFASFVHLFLILCWNLFARSCSVSDLRTHHFRWENDCVVIDMSLQKGDQTGENIEPKHLYANPYEPSQCVILALALHMFAVAFRPDNDDKSLLFIGTPYDVFSKWLPTALQTMANVAVLGYALSDFGTHSFRKGIATFCSGFIGGPSVIAIFLRAGWSLGQVQDRYITFSDGGDQLCGRVAAGLNFNGGSQFCVLPPRFDKRDILTESEWAEICPDYDKYPVGFQSCLPFLLASLVFHWDWLNEKDIHGKLKNISPLHPIFHSRIVSMGIITKLKDNVLGINTSGRCPVTGMTATGVPPHIDLHRQIEDLRKENSELKEQCAANHNEIMERLPTMVTEKVLENVRVEGVQQLSRNDMEGLMRRLMDEYSTHRVPAPETVPATAVPAAVAPDGYPSYHWDGRMHRPVPQGWEFPRGNVKPVCDLFLTGQLHLPQPVRPYRLMLVSTLPRTEQQYYSKAEAVFQKVCSTAVELELVESVTDIQQLSIVEWDSVYRKSFEYLVSKIELQCQTVLRKAGVVWSSPNTKYVI